MIAGIRGPARSDGRAVATQPDAGLGYEEGLEAVEGGGEGVLWVGEDNAGVGDGRMGDGAVAPSCLPGHVRMGGETDGGVDDNADIDAPSAEGSEEALVGVIVGVEDGAVEEDQAPVDELVAPETGVGRRVAESAAHSPSDVANKGHATGDGEMVSDVVTVQRGEDVRVEATGSDGEGGL